MAFLCVVRLMDLHDCVKCIYTILSAVTSHSLVEAKLADGSVVFMSLCIKEVCLFGETLR